MKTGSRLLIFMSLSTEVASLFISSASLDAFSVQEMCISALALVFSSLEMLGVGEEGFDGLGLLEGDLGGSGNCEQVLRALSNAGEHRIHSRMVTGLGLGCNVDTGVCQVSNVLGLDLLL